MPHAPASSARGKRGSLSRVARVPRVRGARAFTLIELMIAVAIVGVLAVVAYAAYHKFVVSSHQTEANHILSGIKNRQEAYKAETGNYMNISKGLAGNQNVNFASLYPHCQSGITKPGAFSVAWNTTPCPGACCNSGTDWLKLKMEVNAPTFYGYSTVADTAGDGKGPVAFGVGLTISGNTPNWPAVNSTSAPWFIATAVGDTDGNGIFTTSWISSFDNEVYIDMDGE
ncbi:MAG: type IV pilin protein [Polyangiaceae bacterium]